MRTHLDCFSIMSEAKLCLVSVCFVFSPTSPLFLLPPVDLPFRLSLSLIGVECVVYNNSGRLAHLVQLVKQASATPAGGPKLNNEVKRSLSNSMRVRAVSDAPPRNAVANATHTSTLSTILACISWLPKLLLSFGETASAALFQGDTSAEDAVKALKYATLVQRLPWYWRCVACRFFGVNVRVGASLSPRYYTLSHTLPARISPFLPIQSLPRLQGGSRRRCYLFWPPEHSPLSGGRIQAYACCCVYGCAFDQGIFTTRCFPALSSCAGLECLHHIDEASKADDKFKHNLRSKIKDLRVFFSESVSASQTDAASTDRCVA